MPRIKIKNFDTFLAKMVIAEGRFRDELIENYQNALEQTADKIAVDAQQFLGKPEWELSHAIKASRIKYYKDHHVVFQAVEPENSLAPVKNTPANYAFFHEYGYVVDASTVSRPRAGGMVEHNRKGNRKAAYRRSPAKRFFRQASDKNIPVLRQKIDEVNQTIKLKLQGGG